MHCGLIVFLFLLVPFSGFAEEEETYTFEEETANPKGMCPKREKGAYGRQYHCPHRYRDYHRYEDRDIDATWPGKRENDFMEELIR